MSKRYTAGVVSSTSPTVNAAGASGVFTLNQQSAAQSTNNWPPYKVEKSLRFRSSASGFLNRTPNVSGNRQIWTWSGWVKRGSLGSLSHIFGSEDDNTSAGNAFGFRFAASNTISVYNYSSAYQLELVTTQVFRDPSAWYHLVLTVDTTQATSSNRVKLYLNGSQITAFGTSTYPPQNTNLNINDGSHKLLLGCYSAAGSTTYYLDGYMSEVNFIDGQALTPSSFGATDKDGNWSPIAYTGSYGTNGFYLNFKDVTSAATTGYDYSGNGNNWTLSGFNVSTANTSYDSMIDVPEDQSDGTANNRGNYCTLNPLQLPSAASTTLTNSNLQLNTNSGSAYNSFANGTIFPTTGKWYAEFEQTGGTRIFAGISRFTDISTPNNWNASSTYYVNTGEIQKDGSTVTTGASWTTGDVIGVAYDADAATCAFYKNNSLQTTVTGVTVGTYSFSVNGYQSGVVVANFGQRPFAYAPPTGFKALNTFNLPEPTIKQPNRYFDIKTRTGANGATPVSGLAFQPDFVWVKGRNVSVDHALFDSVRGVSKTLFTSATNAEESNDTYGYLSAFNSGGYSFTSGSTNIARVDSSSYTYVDWLWNAGGSTVTNTSGSITSSVRANQTAGFSIVTYTGNGVSGATVGHGLGVTPSMVIIKSRSNNTNWQVKHPALNANQNLVLNSTAATDTAPGSGYISAISSSTLTLLNGGSAIINVNDNGSTYVAYCFAPIAGFSAFGSYTGNGSSDGPFVYLGFKPKFILIRRSDIIAGWKIYNTSNLNYNPINTSLEPHDTGAEATSTNFNMDLVSNGFKLKTTYADFNTSGGNYIYMAFAETPFKYARSR